MNHTDGLLCSFDKSWDEFSSAWKKARAKAAEKPIHDLRVSTRRLIATLELAMALTKRHEIGDLQRRFKKVLKSMGPLRDTQVQLEQLSHMRQTPLIVDFKKTLERKEKRRIADIGGELKRGIKRRLSSNVKDVRSEFSRIHESLDAGKTQFAIDRVLRMRRNEFFKAQRRFHKLYPLNEESLHEMRIALKKMRYVVEAAQPVLGTSAKERAKEMHGFQQLLGDTRDVDILRIELDKWASKQGKKIAVVPVLDRLLEKKEKLLKKIVASSTKFETLLQPEAARPAVEKTHLVTSEKPIEAGVKA